MTIAIHIIAMLLLLSPPLLMYGLVVFLAPKLTQQKRWVMGLGACVAVAMLSGLGFIVQHFLGLKDIRIQALVSLVLMILVGMEYNRRYPSDRYK